MQKPLIFCAAVLFIFLFSARGVYACSCAENDMVDKEFARSKNVVVLKAVSPLVPVSKDVNSENRVPGFKFAVQKVFKGTLKPGQEFTVASMGMCNFGFAEADLGSEFLIFYPDDETAMVPMCSRSGHAKWRAADINWLEKIERLRGLTRISGMISQGSYSAVEGEKGGRWKPLEGHTVRVMGHGRDIRLKTDVNGVYEIYGLPPGQYRIEPERIAGYVAANDILTETRSAAVTLYHKGQAERRFNFKIDNAIRGRLVDADGKPLERVQLHLVPARGKPRKYFLEVDYTEKDGSFEFEDVPAGTYVIVGNPDNKITAENPYSRFYSSGTDNRETATEITIGPGEFLENFTVKASKPGETVVILGTLLFEDGTPAAGESVKFATGKDGTKMPGDPYAHTDKDGTFRLTVLKGQKGVVYGHLYPNPYPYRACPEKVEIAKAKANKDENGLLESQRREIDAATEMAGLEIRFPFSLCGRR